MAQPGRGVGSPRSGIVHKSNVMTKRCAAVEKNKKKNKIAEKLKQNTVENLTKITDCRREWCMTRIRVTGCLFKHTYIYKSECPAALIQLYIASGPNLVANTFLAPRSRSSLHVPVTFTAPAAAIIAMAAISICTLPGSFDRWRPPVVLGPWPMLLSNISRLGHLSLCSCSAFAVAVRVFWLLWA